MVPNTVGGEDRMKRMKRRFLWRICVLGFGVPLGLISAVSAYLNRGHAWSELLSSNFAEFAYVFVAGEMIGAYLAGRIMWATGIYQRFTRN